MENNQDNPAAESDEYDAAKKYVGTTKLSGKIQFELLQLEGLLPNSSVLEIGCGCLHAAIHIVSFLDPNLYVGIDPNEWLREIVLREQEAINKLMIDRQATFLSASDFDASALNRAFDFVLSHSILSHAADWQLPLFFQNTSKVLSTSGKIVASIRLSEGNAYGSHGTIDKKDSKHTEWQYPDVSFFSWDTVRQEAEKANLSVRLVPEYTEHYTKQRPDECHDWIVLSKNS